MNIGIIGNGSDKFTFLGQFRARNIIWNILNPPDKLVSGHSIMKGIDIWSEQIAEKKHCEMIIAKPIQESQQYYKIRNDQIARWSDELHIIVVDVYPKEYTGQRFQTCYHHNYDSYNYVPFGIISTQKIKVNYHVKSGACWTGNMFRNHHPDKQPIYHIVNNYD